MKKSSNINLAADYIHPKARMFIRGMETVVNLLDKAVLMEHNRELNNEKLIPEIE